MKGNRMKKIIIVCCFCFISGCQASNSDGKKAFIEDIRQYISVARQISYTNSRSAVSYNMETLSSLYDSAKNKINLMTSNETQDARLIETRLMATRMSVSILYYSMDIYYKTQDKSQWNELINKIRDNAEKMKRDIDVLEQMIYVYENNKSVKNILERNEKEFDY